MQTAVASATMRFYAVCACKRVCAFVSKTEEDSHRMYHLYSTLGAS